MRLYLSTGRYPAAIKEVFFFCRTDYTLVFTPNESEEEKAAVTICRYTLTVRVEEQNKHNNFVIRIEYEWF
jgi:hypothetical protein